MNPMIDLLICAAHVGRASIGGSMPKGDAETNRETASFGIGHHWIPSPADPVGTQVGVVTGRAFEFGLRVDAGSHPRKPGQGLVRLAEAMRRGAQQSPFKVSFGT
jgi:hypothetical protein